MGRSGSEPGCCFETPTGACGASTRARGYCSKHYKVMTRRGAFKAPGLASSTPPDFTRIDPSLDTVARARLKLEAYSEELIDCLVVAAKIAASKGNSAPAENALLHARVLSPLITAGKGDGNSGGVRVLVGVQLGTLPVEPGTVNTLTPSLTVKTLTNPSAIDSSPHSPQRKAGAPDPSAHVIAASTAELPIITAQVIEQPDLA